MRILEDNCVNDNSPETISELSKCMAEFARYLKIQDQILRQKARTRWFEEGDANTAYLHSSMLTQDAHTSNFDALDYIERCITEEDNNMLIAIPTMQEIRDNVFSIDKDSAPGPDGLSGCFYQTTWSIICNDLHRVIEAFFQGAKLPKLFTHTCLFMIPKIDHPQKFSNLRPISLCNVSSTLISKILNNRIATILPKIISKNQSGFIKGRAITENILLAQEIINDINKPSRGGNVVIKLDMAKAYDRVYWNFLCMALKKFGFSDWWKHLVQNFISNIWYFVIVNGGRHGFFESRRCLRTSMKEEDTKGFIRALMVQESITFADDTILFCMVAQGYYMYESSTLPPSRGRAILIRDVLLALPIYLLAATNPPTGTIEVIRKYVARIFWSGQDTEGKHNWVSWTNLCYPYAEGGPNFKSLSDICHAFQTKQWWALRTSDSLWKKFMEAKFYNNLHPTMAQWSRRQSQSWKTLCNIKEEVDNIIIWNIGGEEVAFWYDN
ncbi:uncharacterized protein LOC132038365 [Lycium ferocissimum]|uniref:uncharacterized protein LOC132038365 n=1 Tax=Lycium ferocissimum TaxID=112874 RepID=UPI002815DC86|nr:uncharacterized protein LOC132038365 [Lycium ferocissimum]